MDSDKEENGVAETSAFDQIIDDTSFQRPISKKDDKPVKSRNPSPNPTNDRSSFSMTRNENTNAEDDINTASKNIDDFDDIYDMVEAFEELAHQTKKRLNKMEKINQQCNILPQTLRMCFQALSRGQSDNQTLNSGMEEQITDCMKSSVQSAKEFSKFKNDFFTLSEPILNKDISTLKLTTVKQVSVKQDKCVDKLIQIESNQESNFDEVEQLQKDFSTFEQEAFESRFEKITENQQVIEQNQTDINQVMERCKEELTSAREQAKSITPISKEQRLKLSEFNNKIQRLERKYGKLEVTSKQANELMKNSLEENEEAKKLMNNLKQQPLREMLAQSRKLEKLCETIKNQTKTQGKITGLCKESKDVGGEISTLMCDMGEYVNSFQATMLEECASMGDTIETKAANLDSDIKIQNDRLSQFEERISDIKISDTDQFFLNKEIMRFKNAICSIEAPKESFLEQAIQLKKDIQDRDDKRVTNEDIDQVRQIEKKLDKLEQTELPKVSKNIDGLEMFMTKSLKNQLNEDNKKSQSLISKMKKNYEGFQKDIEKLNLQYGNCRNQVDQFDERFDTDDLERINEIQLIDDKLNDEEQNIYGSTDSQDKKEGEEEVMSPELFEEAESVQKIKKAIISSINSLVNQFNENNKMIKEASKQAKTEKALNELIIKNKMIQSDCEDIHKKIDEGIQMAQEIGERLDEIVNPEITDSLIKKYQDKNQRVADCKQQETKCFSTIERIDTSLSKQVDLVDKCLAKLESVNPIHSNTSNETANMDFYNEVSDKIDETNTLREEIEQTKEELKEFSEQIEQVKLPILHMSEREVPVDPEIEELSQKLTDIQEDVSKVEQSITGNSTRLVKLQKAIDSFLESEILRKLKIGQESVQTIDSLFDNSQVLKTGSNQKLKFYKDQLDKHIAKSKKESGTDSILLEKLRDMADEALVYEKDLTEIDNKLKDYKRKKGEAKKAIDEIEKNPNKFTPSQIDNMLVNLDDISDKSKNNDEKMINTNKVIESKIQDLEKLLESNESKKTLLANIDQLLFELDDDLENLKDILEKLPDQVKVLVRVLREMELSTGAEEDYVEKKDEINENLGELEELADDVDKMLDSYNNQKSARRGLNDQLARSQSIENIKKVTELIQKQKQDVANIASDCVDAKEQIDDLKRDIGDSELQTNVDKRKNELLQFCHRMERLQKEYKNLKKANDKKQNPQITQNMRELDFKLKAFEKDKVDLNKFLKNELDCYKALDYEDFQKNHEIVKKVRNFKGKLEDTEKKLKDVEDVLNEVERSLTEQDMENSVELLGLKSQELNERLMDTKMRLVLIQRSGQEMDGNTSNDEEEEFINALKNEMPEVFENMETTVALLKEADVLVNEVKKTLNIQKYQDLKHKINIATENVDESENLVVKLEKEIIEWNALKKLQRRDNELDEIQLLCSGFIEDLGSEKYNTEIELEKNKEKQEENRDQELVDKDGNKVDIMDDLMKLESQMISYNSEISKLLIDINQLDQQKDVCFEEFNNELPKSVKDLRKFRKKEQAAANKVNANLKRPAMLTTKQHIRSKTSMANGEAESQSNIYDMIGLNCRFKKRIQQMLKDLKQINNRSKKLEEDYSQMRKEVFKIKQIKLYKPVRGDVVDEMFAGYLNKAKVDVEVQRTSAGNYLFGTKKIIAKIINGKLVIRVGGGYMNAEEFIEQYGEIEVMKMMKIQQQQANKDIVEGIAGLAGVADGRKSEMTARRSGTLATGQTAMDIRDKMRKALVNVKPYANTETGRATIDPQSMGSLAQSFNTSSRQSLGGKSISNYKSNEGGVKPKNGEQFSNKLKSALMGVKKTGTLAKGVSSTDVGKSKAATLALPVEDASMKSPEKQKTTTPLSSRKSLKLNSLSGLGAGGGGSMNTTRNSTANPTGGFGLRKNTTAHKTGDGLADGSAASKPRPGSKMDYK